MSIKFPNPTDKYVGSRVRMRRLMLHMSQERLADQLGLTFQQVQKYEKGTNRIGASRLQHIAEILQVPISFFFEGAPPVPRAIEKAWCGTTIAGARGRLPPIARWTCANKSTWKDQGSHAAP